MAAIPGGYGRRYAVHRSEQFWENGYAESFKSRMRDESLDGELCLHIDEIEYVVER